MVIEWSWGLFYGYWHFLSKISVDLNLTCPVKWTRSSFLMEKTEQASREKKLRRIDDTGHLRRSWSLGVGRNCVPRGTCHMLPESGLRQKPIKYKQDSQPARASPERGRGAETGWRFMFVQPCLCVLCFYAKQRDSCCGNLWVNRRPSLW